MSLFRNVMVLFIQETSCINDLFSIEQYGILCIVGYYQMEMYISSGDINNISEYLLFDDKYYKYYKK